MIPFPPEVESLRESLPAYTRLLQAQVNLLPKLVQHLGPEGIRATGKALGLLDEDGKTLLLPSEEAMIYVVDTALFLLQDARARSPLDNFEADPGVVLTRDERAFVAALRQAEFVFLEVEEAFPGVGIRFHDHFADRTRMVIDVNLSKTIPPHGSLIGRIMPFANAWMSTGSILPYMILTPRDGLDRSDLEKRFASMGSVWRSASPLTQKKMAVDFIRRLLEEGHADDVQAQPIPRPRRPSRNGLCPCGSGKRYKGCCGAG